MMREVRYGYVIWDAIAEVEADSPGRECLCSGLRGAIVPLVVGIVNCTDGGLWKSVMW